MLVEGKNEVYSWGLGENYVLGNRDDCNQFKPYKMDPRMFEENKVLMMACGTQHATCLALAPGETKAPELDLSKWDGTPFVVEEPTVQKTPQK